MTKTEPGASAPDPALHKQLKIIESVKLGPRAESLGRVEEAADGLAVVSGLGGAELGELLKLEDGGLAYVLNLEPDVIHAVLLDSDARLVTGSTVRRTGRLMSVPVGEALLGRVVDSLGRPLDGGEPIAAARFDPTERPAPSIIERGVVSEPVQTGILAIDALFALGRGQRELIIGERATGKTSIAVDTIINQKNSDMICIYVATGQRATSVERVIEEVRARGAIERCIFVVAPATAEPGLQWLAPFAGMTIAEFFRDRGDPALIVFDDLTKHAIIHRQLALLARQPPGREAYPANIFYLHARLLERAAKLSDAMGGGSLTALPIAEIEGNNLAAYIPTNLISISDGQIVLSTQLFAANQRPAVDVGMSVSRVGGKAQLPALKEVAGRVRMEYAQYQELKMFSRFGSFNDASVKLRIAHGERISALLAQHRFSPLAPVDQIALLAAHGAGALDHVPIKQIIAAKALVHGLIESDPRLAKFRDHPEKLDDTIRSVLIACVTDAVALAAAGQSAPASAPASASAPAPAARPIPEATP